MARSDYWSIHSFESIGQFLGGKKKLVCLASFTVDLPDFASFLRLWFLMGTLALAQGMDTLMSESKEILQ